MSAPITLTSQRPRARLRDLGLAVGTLPTGPLNAITDVADVRVGHVTLIADSPHVVRTGVTAVLPFGQTRCSTASSRASIASTASAR
jgi:L-aminopeptidase/D-esterase-like protein